MEPLVAMQGKMKQGHILNGTTLEQKDAQHPPRPRVA